MGRLNQLNSAKQVKPGESPTPTPGPSFQGQFELPDTNARWPTWKQRNCRWILCLTIFGTNSDLCTYHLSISLDKFSKGLEFRVFLFIGNFCLPSGLGNPVLSTILPTAVEKSGGFLPFPKALAQIEKKSTTSRIWIRITEFISSDDNRYGTRLSNFTHISRGKKSL